MKGLLKKDLYQMRAYAGVIILAGVIMMGASVVTLEHGNNFFMVYAGFLMGMFPMTLLAYDQNSRFAEYGAALPVTEAQLVGCKYIIGLCAMLLAELLAVAALGAACLYWGTVSRELAFSTLLQVAAATLVSNAIVLPLTYRLGFEKGKYVYYLCIGLIAAWMGFGLSSDDGMNGSGMNLLPAGISPLVPLGVALVGLALYAASWRLSVAWYGKAEA